MKTVITGKELLEAGFTEGPVIGFALDVLGKNSPETEATPTPALLKKLHDYPESFLDDPVLAPIAQKLVEAAAAPADDTIALKPSPGEYAIYGTGFIEEGARKQMNTAMQLPVTVGGALMPDAHQGYGLPIGGVLATQNAVIPYGVGVDIGCRMALSVYDIPETHFNENLSKYKRELIAQTQFGAGAGFPAKHRRDHAVLQNGLFSTDPFIAALKDKAWAQLGSSGGGNHFVEFGVIEFAEDNALEGIAKGRYLALLSHSGSRGLGATIAGHYTRLAKEQCKLPQEAANLAYLPLDTDAGRGYWAAMNLAGDYASACHEIIHAKMTKAIGATRLATVENHHNFAWKERWKGEEVIVHRKGATPAGKGVLGIIPGSMTAPGFLVRGRGAEEAIQSASHGAGRQMSRTQATKSISREQLRAELKAHEVMLIGAGLDEAPMAYKDIRKVMAAQTDLVDTLATFTPRMVRMADDGSRED
ncbi:MAG: RtcB family protein [Flavihumibacter sp.]